MNAGALVNVSILAMWAYTLWRVVQSRRAMPGQAGQQDRVSRVWAAGGLSVVISALGDLDPALGAAFGMAIALGLIAGQGPAGAFTGMLSRVNRSLGKATPSSSASAAPAAASPPSVSPPNVGPGSNETWREWCKRTGALGLLCDSDMPRWR